MSKQTVNTFCFQVPRTLPHVGTVQGGIVSLYSSLSPNMLKHIILVLSQPSQWEKDYWCCYFGQTRLENASVLINWTIVSSIPLIMLLSMCFSASPHFVSNFKVQHQSSQCCLGNRIIVWVWIALLFQLTSWLHVMPQGTALNTRSNSLLIMFGPVVSFSQMVTSCLCFVYCTKSLTLVSVKIAYFSISLRKRMDLLMCWRYYLVLFLHSFVDLHQFVCIYRLFLQCADYSLHDYCVPPFGLIVGYQTLACPESFAGTNFRTMEEEVKKKVDTYASELLSSYEDFQSEGVHY